MGKSYKIAVLSGDGIGPEVVAEALKVLEAIEDRFDIHFDFEHALMGAVAIDQTGDPLPPETVEACLRSDAILFGAIGHPKYDNDPSAKVRPEQGLLALRKKLGLFANIRPVTTYDSLLHLSPLKAEKIQGADFVVYRELTGGIYFGEKTRSADGQYASDLCAYSVFEIERIAHLAFRAAQTRRGKLTLVDKANVLETSRLWRETVRRMSAEYPDVEVDYMFVDNAAMQMIQWPTQFDVLLTSNMFGDIISDEASVIAGSMGLLPSASIGAETSLFEPIHGSYPQAAGKNIANPVATILSAAMLLDSLDLVEAGDLVRQAIKSSLDKNQCTVDLNADTPFSTSELGDLIASTVREAVAF
ncbi:MAG: 3-isopropylmalate dehydrogenase [Saprospiraceae bacterium]|nr:3-isopropylmalate dehydrogenase [Saprospiraceae bacterium]